MWEHCRLTEQNACTESPDSEETRDFFHFQTSGCNMQVKVILPFQIWLNGYGLPAMNWLVFIAFS
jgi:hypothetical protein